MSNSEQSKNSDPPSPLDDEESPKKEGTAPPASKNPTTAGRRKRDEESDWKTNKNARVNDIKELVEHLIVVGNHHRHQHWRRKVYEESPQQNTTQDNKKASSTHQDEDSPSASDTVPNQNVRSILLNVNDNLVYGQRGDKGAGDLITFWPDPAQGPVKKRRTQVSDDQWDEFWGDGVNPIAFSNQRLSAAHSYELWDANGNPKRDGLHPSSAAKSIDASDATRSILLRCWHRAVHAASQITVIDTHATGRSEGSPHLERTVNLAQDTSQSGSMVSPPSDPTLDNPSPGASLNQRQDSFSRMDTETRNPALARKLSANLGIELPTPSSDSDAGSFCCPVCQVKAASMQQLESHYYGTPNTRGCSWTRIQRRKEALVDETLQAEVLLQARQLAQLVATRSVEAVTRVRGSPSNETLPAFGGDDFFRPAFDWSHIQDILIKMLASVQPRDCQSATLRERASGVLATLDLREPFTGADDFTLTTPPLFINRFILEATVNRIQERYTRVPK